jgi:hypothetical protein
MKKKKGLLGQVYYTVIPAIVVTSIKQSPVLKGQLFCPVLENLI